MKTEWKNGLLLFASIALFFLFADLIGQSDKLYLRVCNIFIVFYFVNKTIKSKIDEGKDNYVQNFAYGVATAFIGVILSVFGFFIYIIAIRGIEHLTILSEPLIGGGGQLSLAEYTFAILAEGISSSVIVTFILMQYWKNNKKEV